MSGYRFEHYRLDVDRRVLIARERVIPLSEKIFGVLLNEIDLKHPGYGHYSHYYNHYTRPDSDLEMPFKDSGGQDSA